MKKLNAVIYGAGSIGALKPEKLDNKTLPYSLTHASAIYKNPNIDLMKIYDADLDKQIKANDKWSTLSGRVIDYDVDIVVIACSTWSHFDCFLGVLEQRPKYIVIEKPFGSHRSEAIKMHEMCKENGINLITSYSRRFLKEYTEDFKEVLDSHEALYCRLLYDRGVVREASHAIDLFNHWFGDFKYVEDSIYFSDSPDGDGTYDCRLVYEKCPTVHLHPISYKHYGMFEIEIFTKNGRYVFSKNGGNLKAYFKEREPVYGNYDIMGDVCIQGEIQIEKTLDNMYNEIVNHHKGKVKKLSSTGENGIKVHNVLEKIKSFGSVD